MFMTIATSQKMSVTFRAIIYGRHLMRSTETTFRFKASVRIRVWFGDWDMIRVRYKVGINGIRELVEHWVLK